MPHRPSHNGHVLPHINGWKPTKDPLAPNSHTVLIESEPGKFTIVNSSTEPVEMLRLATAMSHAVGMQTENLLLVDDDARVVERYDNYVPEPQPEGAPLTERNREKRDRWIYSILRWLLPGDLRDKIDTASAQRDIQNYLVEHCIEMAVRPDGNKVVFIRDAKELAAWCATI